tara:strand:+ start:545 stop:772 length:228 start_codon:yes stop_codon:yes gene_type:complete
MTIKNEIKILKQTDSMIIGYAYASYKEWKRGAKRWTWFFSDYIYSDYESKAFKKTGKLRQLCILGHNFGILKVEA